MENFIPIYPSSEDPDIQRIVTAKKEFNDLRPDITQAIRKEKRELLNHQELFARLMTISDRMLNIFETGSGKTCSFIGMAEKYKFKGAFRGCIVVEKSDILINETQKQILDKCTPEGEYSMIDTEDQDITDRIRKKRRKEILKSWYLFYTYEKFSNELEDLTDDQIRAKYNKYIIIFDEAHNMISDKEDIQGWRKYSQFSRLCHNIPQSKICLVTATPMRNKPFEAIYLLNLLVSETDQIPIRDSYRLSELERYIRGKVSFIKSRLADIKVEYMGTPFIFKDSIMEYHPTDPSKDPRGPTEVKVPINMYLTTMGDLQEEQFSSVYGERFKSITKKRSTIVFPIINGELTKGEDYIEEKSGTVKWKTFTEFLDWEERGEYTSFQDWIYNRGDFSNLSRISGKLTEILKIELNSPGCSFIYNPLVENAGVKFIMMVMSLFGFEQFTESTSEAIFANIKKTKIKESFKKKPRIAIITGGAYGTETRQNTILDLFNSDANVNGEYIKILIGSGKAKEGINVYHCQRMHLFFPHWNYSGMVQSINRVLRVSGHNALKEQREREAVDLGYQIGTPEYDKYINISVKIYRHCIDYNLDRNIRGLDTDNSDYVIMKRAIEKEISITKMMNMLKICAVDNLINREENYFRPEDPFNFDKVRYLPSWTEIQYPEYVPFVTDPIDYSTYNILYIDTYGTVDKMKKLLIAKGSVSYESIYEQFKDLTKEEIFEAISSLRGEGKYITNNLGEKLSLEISDNGIHLQRFSYPADIRMIHNISIYDYPKSIVSDKSIAGYIGKYRHDMIRRFFVDFVEQKSTSGDEKEIKQKTEILRKKDIWIQMNILEELILYKYKKSYFQNMLIPRAFLDDLIDIFKGYIFDFTYDSPPCIAHVMTITSAQENSHNVLAKHRNPKQVKIFVLNEPNISWRVVYDMEEQKYKNLIRAKIDGDMAAFEKYSIFGMYLQDGKFRLVEDVSEAKPTGEINSGEDRRMAQRGKDPKSINKKSRIKIAVIEKLKPPCNPKVKKESISYLRESIKADQSAEYVKSLTDEEVMIYHAWDACTNVDKCFQIEIIKKLTEDNRLYSPYILTH